jgi:uncharacterized protein (DUF983 family)
MNAMPEPEDSAIARVWSNSENTASPAPERDVFKAMFRGARLRCPNCGARALFSSYLRVADTCPACGEALHHHRADDAPPYFTIFIVGHIVVSLLMTVELTYAPPIWLHLAIWLPLAAALCLLLLPPVKGAIVGLQWAHRMHGFGGEEDSLQAPKDIIKAG